MEGMPTNPPDEPSTSDLTPDEGYRIPEMVPEGATPLPARRAVPEVGPGWYGKRSGETALAHGVRAGMDELDALAGEDPEMPTAAGTTYAHMNSQPEDPALLAQMSVHQLAQRLKKLTARHELVARMVATGASDDEIIGALGRYTKARLAQIRRSPRFIQRVTQLQNELVGKGIGERFSRIGNRAVTLAESLMEDRQTTPALKYKITQDFMDRAYGKAKETIKVDHNTVGDLFAALDKMNRGQMRELPPHLAAQFAGTVPAATPHPIDTAIENLVPETNGIAAREEPQP